MKRRSVPLLLCLVACASVRSARYVQLRALQANVDARAAEALDAGLIDTATAKRILAISEAVSEQARKYRHALAEGASRDVTDAILEVIERLLRRADLFLSAPGVEEANR